VIMCHPGINTAQDNDDIGQTRMREFQYLRDKEFGNACRSEGVTLVRFRRRQ